MLAFLVDIPVASILSDFAHIPPQYALSGEAICEQNWRHKAALVSRTCVLSSTKASIVFW